MRISSLQQYILIRCLENRGSIDRLFFRQYYDVEDVVANIKFQENNITRSLERLIDRGILIGLGKRTARRWFITHVRLTPRGRKLAINILNSRQRKLPF